MIRSLWKHSRWILIGSIAAGVVSGLSGAALLALINSGLQEPQAASGLVWSFAGLCGLVLVGGVFSETWLARLGQNSVYDLRIELARRILATPLDRLQALGRHRLMATLTDDIASIAQVHSMLPTLCIDCAGLVGALGYLGWLSWRCLLLALGFMLAGVLLFEWLQSTALKNLRRARDLNDRLFDQFRALTEGVKELQLHQARRRRFLEQDLRGTTDGIRRSYNRGIGRLILATQGGNLLFYVLIGVMLFIPPQVMTISPAALSGYVLGILYMMNPLADLMHAWPEIGRARIAEQKIAELQLQLHAEDRPEVPAAAPVPQRLELIGVEREYSRTQEPRPFRLGPIDLSIEAGELLFLAGGNGSGKTTLCLVIAGLYTPDRGRIVLGENEVGAGTLEAYRQSFAAVFSDAWLFETLSAEPTPETLFKAQLLLRRFDLDGKVRIDQDRFSSLDLSQGQRKRLALLSAYLDDRPFYLFDEWAADQDPEFKELFYRVLLPELKARGKTVLVISHDEQYFSVADRMVRLIDGRIGASMPSRPSVAATHASADVA
jgi:putative ATP-binding cassette transporter